MNSIQRGTTWRDLWRMATCAEARECAGVLLKAFVLTVVVTGAALWAVLAP